MYDSSETLKHNKEARYFSINNSSSENRLWYDMAVTATRLVERNDQEFLTRSDINIREHLAKEYKLRNSAHIPHIQWVINPHIESITGKRIAVPEIVLGQQHANYSLQVLYLDELIQLDRFN